MVEYKIFLDMATSRPVIGPNSLKPAKLFPIYYWQFPAIQVFPLKRTGNKAQPLEPFDGSAFPAVMTFKTVKPAAFQIAARVVTATLPLAWQAQHKAWGAMPGPGFTTAGVGMFGKLPVECWMIKGGKNETLFSGTIDFLSPTFRHWYSAPL